MDQIKVIQYNAESFETSTLADVSDLRRFASDSKITWVNVDGIHDRELIDKIADTFGFHQLVLEDIVSTRQRAKVESYDDQLLIVARAPNTAEEFRTEQIAMVQCHNVVLSFHEGKGDVFDAVRRRLKNRIGCIRDHGQDYLLYSLLDAVIDSYFPVVEQIREKIDEIENELAEAPGVDVIAKLQSLRSILFLLQSSAEPHREVVTQMRRSEKQFMEESRVYLRDTQDHLSQVIHATETNRELAADLRDYCFAELSFNQNETMKLLTVVASVFIPLSFIVGLYGMNFDPELSSVNMPELKWKYGYIYAISLMATVVVLALGGLWFLKRSQQRSRCRRFRNSKRILSDQ